MRKKTVIFLLFGILPWITLHASGSEKTIGSLKNDLFQADDPEEKVKIYLKLAKHHEREQADTAFYYLGQARSLARQSDNPSLLGDVYYAMGNIYVIQNKLDLALSDYTVAYRQYQRGNDTMMYTRMLLLIGNILIVRDDAGAGMAKYMEAIGLAEKHGYYSILAHLYNNSGEVYAQFEDWKKSMEYYRRALDLFTKNKDSLSIGIILQNMGLVYFKLGDPDMAHNYIERALKVFERDKDPTYDAICYMLLGMLETSKGNCTGAEDLLEKSMIGFNQNGREYQGPKNVNYAELLIRIGINYLRLGNYNRALEYLHKGYNLARSMKLPRMVILAAENLSETYEKIHGDSKALQFYKIYAHVSDSLSEVITVKAVELTEIRQESIKKQQENELIIKYERSRRSTLLIIYLISGMILLAVIVILFLMLKLEKNRKRQADLEKKALDEKLDFQNREMTTNVMYINKMNEQVVQIAEKLKSLSIDENSENARVIKSIIRELLQDSQTDTLKEFEVRFGKIHNEFYRKLTEKFADLTPNELKLCAFLRLNMSTKEISSLTYQTENSIMVARTRLRQKLALTRNENLVTFLSQF